MSRPLVFFEPDEPRAQPWPSAQRFMSDQLRYVRRHFIEPELPENLSDRLHQVNALFLLTDLEAAGVTTLRDLTHWACLVTQEDYLYIAHEAIGLGNEHEPDGQTNLVAWAELMFVLRLEESIRCWPDVRVSSQLSLLREQYALMARELYQRINEDYLEWGPLSPRLRRRCTARLLNLTRWA